MLARPGVRFQPLGVLLADRLVAALLSAHPAAGRRGRGRAPIGSERPTIHDVARALVRRVGDGEPFGQAALARWVGLSRPTVCHYLGVWMAAGLVERVDDQGRPVARGTSLPLGTAARYQLATTWTAELVDLMPAHWRPRLELAWASLRQGAPDELVGACLRRSPAANGERALTAWYRRRTREHRRSDRRRTRALQAAAERAERSGGDPDDEGLEGIILRLPVFGAGNSTPPRTEHSPSAPKGPSGRAPSFAHAREARPGKPARRAEPSPEQLRWAVEHGLVDDVAEAGVQWAELARAGELVAEDDPVAVWGQLGRLADRHGRRLDELVGRYVLAVDELRADIAASVAADRRPPVREPAAYVCGMVRRALRRPRPPELGDQVVEQLAPAPALHVVEPAELEPERRLSADQRRAIRERVEAAREPAGAACGDRPAEPAPGRLLALLERVRAERRTGGRGGAE